MDIKCKKLQVITNAVIDYEFKICLVFIFLKKVVEKRREPIPQLSLSKRGGTGTFIVSELILFGKQLLTTAGRLDQCFSIFFNLRTGKFSKQLLRPFAILI